MHEENAGNLQTVLFGFWRLKMGSYVNFLSAQSVLVSLKNIDVVE